MLLCGGLLLLAITAFFMARGLLRPPRMTDGKAAYLLNRLSPSELGLTFLPLTFTVRDESDVATSAAANSINLAAWWIPNANSDKTAILMHGYADAKVGALAWAPPFYELGYNLLLPDLRAHGESGGRLSTGGYWERHDISQLINDLRARYPDQTKHLILFGASLGAAVAVALAADRTDIEAIVMESPFTDFRRAASGHFDLLGIGLKPLHHTAIWLSERMAKASFATLRPLDLIPKSHCPILIIQGAGDPLTTLGDQTSLQQAIKSRNDGSLYWKLENIPHLMAIAADPRIYRDRLSGFLGNSRLPHTKV
jgi:pimeloyl-ACP methyl ester carboxylesterase